MPPRRPCSSPFVPKKRKEVTGKRWPGKKGKHSSHELLARRSHSCHCAISLEAEAIETIVCTSTSSIKEQTMYKRRSKPPIASLAPRIVSLVPINVAMASSGLVWSGLVCRKLLPNSSRLYPTTPTRKGPLLTHNHRNGRTCCLLEEKKTRRRG